MSTIYFLLGMGAGLLFVFLLVPCSFSRSCEHSDDRIQL